MDAIREYQRHRAECEPFIELARDTSEGEEGFANSRVRCGLVAPCDRASHESSAPRTDAHAERVRHRYAACEEGGRRSGSTRLACTRSLTCDTRDYDLANFVLRDDPRARTRRRRRHRLANGEGTTGRSTRAIFDDTDRKEEDATEEDCDPSRTRCITTRYRCQSISSSTSGHRADCYRHFA